MFFIINKKSSLHRPGQISAIQGKSPNFNRVFKVIVAEKELEINDIMIFEYIEGFEVTLDKYFSDLD